MLNKFRTNPVTSVPYTYIQGHIRLGHDTFSSEQMPQGQTDPQAGSAENGRKVTVNPPVQLPNSMSGHFTLFKAWQSDVEENESLTQS
jgi:hypothetical protein